MNLETFIILVLVIFFPIIEYRVVLSFLSFVLRRRSSRKWVKTTGKIANVEVHEEQVSSSGTFYRTKTKDNPLLGLMVQAQQEQKRTSYRTEIKYTFDANGSTCESHFFREGAHAEIILKNPQLTVWYDPLNPHRCITSMETIWEFALPVLLYIGVIALIVLSFRLFY